MAWRAEEFASAVQQISEWGRLLSVRYGGQVSVWLWPDPGLTKIMSNGSILTRRPVTRENRYCHVNGRSRARGSIQLQLWGKIPTDSSWPIPALPSRLAWFSDVASRMTIGWSVAARIDGQPREHHNSSHPDLMNRLQRLLIAHQVPGCS